MIRSAENNMFLSIRKFQDVRIGRQVPIGIKLDFEIAGGWINSGYVRGLCMGGCGWVCVFAT